MFGERSPSCRRCGPRRTVSINSAPFVRFLDLPRRQEGLVTDLEQIHADLEHIIELLNTLVGLIALQEN
jgi:hypothetical protein